MLFCKKYVWYCLFIEKFTVYGNSLLHGIAEDTNLVFVEIYIMVVFYKMAILIFSSATLSNIN